MLLNNKLSEIKTSKTRKLVKRREFVGKDCNTTLVHEIAK
jgi:hypothetical protein